MSNAADPNRLPAPVVMCADDYGLHRGISRAVLELIEIKRLSAVSCMTGGPAWETHAPALKALRGRIDVGIHLTLTELAPLGAMPSLAPAGRLPGLGRLMALAFARRLDRGEIEREFTRQLDRFEALAGGPPDYLDGHHHAHQLPVVRDAVADLIRIRYAARPPYVRGTAIAMADALRIGVEPLKAFGLGLIGRTARRRAREAGAAVNPEFRGVRAFTADEDPAVLFPRFLAGAPAGTIVMCHPGLRDPAAAPDSIADAREGEYRYLASDAFAAVLAAAGVRPARFAEAAR